jgi:hypothetical protein
MWRGRGGQRAAARNTAKNFEFKLRNHIDPAAERRALRAHEGHTLGDAIEQYLSAIAGKRRENTLRSVRFLS